MPISFDRAADYYDETRGYPPGVAAAIGNVLCDLANAGPHTLFLELGVGTGRIALPIIRAGHRYTGVDLSARMMDRLRSSLREIPGAEERVELVEGNIEDLPFADRRFDVVLTVHVLHLVDHRERVIEESTRVLRRPGIVLNGWDDTVEDPTRPLADQWHALLHDLGHETSTRRDWDRRSSIAAEWVRNGGTVDGPHIAATWEASLSPAHYFSRLEHQMYSNSWRIPPDVFSTAIRQLREWARPHYGDTWEQPNTIKRRFMVERAIFTEEDNK